MSVYERTQRLTRPTSLSMLLNEVMDCSSLLNRLTRKRGRSSFLLGSLLGLLFSLASVLLVDAELSELSVDLDASDLLGDLLRGLSDLSLGKSENSSGGVLGGGGLDLLGGGISDVTLLWLVGSSGEEDQLALVAFKSLHIQLKSLLGQIVSSVVNSDADGSGESGGDLGLGEFLESETSSIS